MPRSDRWTPVSVASLLTMVIAGGGGCGSCSMPPQASAVGAGDNAYLCTCTCGGPGGFESQSRSQWVCMPDALNPNKGHPAPTVDQLSKDCNDRICVGAGQQFGAFAKGSCLVECSGVATAPPGSSKTSKNVAVCNNGCTSVLCKSDGSNFCGLEKGDATSDCCTVIPPVPGCGFNNETPAICVPNGGDPPGLLSELTSHDSEGAIDRQSSSVRLTPQGASAVTTAVAGSIDLFGRPAPDGSFGVSLSLFPDDFTSQGVSFSQISAVAYAMQPGALILANGRGDLGTNAFDVTARGTASASGFFGLISESGTRAAELIPQADPPLHFTVDFAAHTFSMTGSFNFGGDSSNHIPPFAATTHLVGKLVNEPPTSVAGPDQTVECTSPSGARVTLDGSGSQDPDNNITDYTWWRGAAYAGKAVSHDARAQVEVPLGSQSLYTLSVGDAFGQIDNAATHVAVRDTTPPVIQSIAVHPDCLWPPNHSLVLLRLGQEIQVGATDVCDPSPVIFIREVTSNQPPLGGGSGNTATDLIFGRGAVCLRSERDGAAGPHHPRIYTITIAALDHSGNEADGTIEVTVPHDQSGGGCPLVSGSLLVSDGDPRCTADAPNPPPADAASDASSGASAASTFGTASPGAGGCDSGGPTPAILLLLLPFLLSRRVRGG